MPTFFFWRASINQAIKRTRAASRRKSVRLAVEVLEDRCTPASGALEPATPELVAPTPLWQFAIERAADLSQYTAEQLASTRLWVVGFTESSSPTFTEPNRTVTSTELLPNTVILQLSDEENPTALPAELLARSDVSYFYPLIVHQMTARTMPNDALIGNQWHLKNTGQNGGTPGQDINAEPVWTSGITGAGVLIGIVDDGLQHTHPDLSPNYVAAHSFDFNFNDADPTPSAADDHGTSAAGVAAAKGNNSIGVAGAAYNASLAGLRLIALANSDSQEANALTYHSQDIDIYSNSWGPADDGETLEAPGPLTLAAFQTGVTSGRGGLGNIYTWAAGNGLAVDDNSNYDGYANLRYVIAVTAIAHNGTQSSYAEPGANILVAAYSSSSGLGPGITTTDLVGANGSSATDYTSNFGGTSSATPLVSGVVALMLQANPNLTWRDVQHVLARSALKNNPADTGWALNTAGHDINRKYGFGAVSAQTAVALASTWNTVSTEMSASTAVITVNQPIPDNGAAVISTTNFTGNIRAERVEVVFNATHTYRGDLEVILTSPGGTQSVLAEVHDDLNNNYTNWVFSSTRLLDEVATGNWTLSVRDGAGGDTGQFQNWTLRVYGTSAASDFGDAPNTYGTLLASNGARHSQLSNLALGASKDTEANAPGTLDGTTDGADENGVTLPGTIFNNGGSSNYTVNVAGGAGKLDAWIDFNRDGDFTDSGEKIANSVAVSAGNNALSFVTPVSAVPGASYARFRLSSVGGLVPTGAALDGEVEDYNITIATVSAPTLSASRDGSGNLTITDTDAVGKNNQFTVSRSGNVLTISDANASFISAPSGGTLSNGNTSLSFNTSVTSINSITINGALGNDTATINFATGNPIPSGSITFNGGNPTSSPADLLVLTGGTTTSANHNFTNSNSGSVSLAGALTGTINYTGVEDVTDSLTIVNRTFTANGGAETITLAAAGANTTIDSTLGAAVLFSNPSGALAVDAGAGSDIINVNGLGAGYVGTLSINGGADADTINQSANFNAAPGSGTFSNPAAITIPALGAASPYPSNIAVSGLSGTITAVTATLSGYSHTFGEDVNFLLVGPGGAKVELMRNAGGSGVASSFNYTFADGSPALTDATPISPTGTYRPSQYGAAVTYPASAPAGPYGTAMSAFNGASANGTWSLYVYDDGSGDSGSISGGWSLNITTNSAAAIAGVSYDAEDVNLTGNIATNGAVNITAANVNSTAAGTISTGTGVTVNNTGNASTLVGIIGGAGGLTKAGAGTLATTGTNTYAGTTTVNGGALLVNGNNSGAAGAIAVNNSGTLGGGGTVGGAVTVNAGGRITGGTDGTVGTLTLPSLNFNGGTYRADIVGNSGDKLLVSGAVNLNAGSAGLYNLASSDSTTGGTVFTLIDKTSAGAITNPPFTGVAQGSTTTVDGKTATYSYTAGTGANDFTLSVATTPAPTVTGLGVNVLGVADADWDSNEATITTLSAHGLAVGESITIANMSVAGYNGSYTVATVLDSQTFTYAVTGPLADNASGGTITGDASNTQRSRMTSLVVTFNTAINMSHLLSSIGAFTLSQENGNFNQPPALTYNGQSGGPDAGGINITVLSSTQVVLTFESGLAGVEFGSLSDGSWKLVVDDAAIKNTGGANMAADYVDTSSITRLYGDVDGDGVVDINDLTPFGTTFGSAFGDDNFLAAFDIDESGTIDINDLTEFGGRFGLSL